MPNRTIFSSRFTLMWLYWMASAFVLLVVNNGCGRDPDNPLSAEVSDKTGNHKLVLNYVSSGPGPVPRMD
jgi:hypothetical protein